MIRKYPNHTLQTNIASWGRAVTRHQEDKQSKATRFLFSIRLIAKLEKTQSNAQQNTEQT